MPIDYISLQQRLELDRMEAELRRMQNPSPVVPALLGGLIGFWLGRKTAKWPAL